MGEATLFWLRAKADSDSKLFLSVLPACCYACYLGTRLYQRGPLTLIIVFSILFISRDPGGMFVGGMCKVKEVEYPDATQPTVMRKVKIPIKYFNSQSSARTEMDAASKDTKTQLHCMRSRSISRPIPRHSSPLSSMAMSYLPCPGKVS